MATPAGPYPSYASSTIVSPSSSPVPFLTARSILTLGMFASFAVSIASRSRGLPSGSPPPALAATVISRINLVHAEARRLSVTAFFRLICFHLLWPAIVHLFGSGPKISSSGRVDATCHLPLGFPPYATDLASRFLAPCPRRVRRRPSPPPEPSGRLRDHPAAAVGRVYRSVGERRRADVHLPLDLPGGLDRRVLPAGLHLGHALHVALGLPGCAGGARVLRRIPAPADLGADPP